MATLEGARALGMDKQIGSLLPGKAADCVAVKLDEWDLQPCYDPLSHLVYVAGREHVSHVWVAGMLRIRDKMPVNLDTHALLMKTQLWQNALSNQC
jgi:5-methylthioadenosine/S-adenosylhomocysteine deaminase